MSFNRKHKILFILPLPPPIHGSAIMSEVIKNSRLVNESFDCHYINLSISASIDEIGRKKIGKIFRYNAILWQVLKQLLVFKPQLCYIAPAVQGYPFYKDLIVALLAKLFRVRIIYHFHNKGVSARQHNFFDNIMYHIAFTNTEVLLIGKRLYADIQKYVPEKKVYYCPNGIGDKIDSQKRIKKDSSVVEILFLSNLIKEKGVFVLLEACNELKNRKCNFRCTLAGSEGDISKKQFYSRVEDMNLMSNVYYVGGKYGKEKGEVFASTDIFAFPTFYHNETFGLVLLEAMQYSLPVVSTFEGYIPEIVDDGVTGFLVPKKDVAALADKMEMLINDESLRKRMGEEGRRKYEKEFTSHMFENKLTSILQSMIA